VTPDPGPVFHRFLTPDPGPKEKRRILPESTPVNRIRSQLWYIACRVSGQYVVAKDDGRLRFLFQVVEGNVGIFHSYCRGNLLM